jgi:hypothetical protein
MWNETPIERATYAALESQLGESAAKERFGLYTTARQQLVEDILPNIKIIIPESTDHGPGHVAHVLENAGSLLQIESERTSLSGIELYSLILAILFHDAGNIYGREDHQRKISSIYDYCRAVAANDHQEKFIVIKMTQAHCGTAESDSNDTLQSLGPDAVPLFRQPVRLRDIAAILRFADELAEGPNRTSLFMQQHHGYSSGNEIFHMYSGITQIYIEPRNDRIALTYNIDVKTLDSKGISSKEESRLKNLLKYCYERINKLDQERKYAKHYCEFLGRFKKTTVTFNFWMKGLPHNLGLSALTLTDLEVPGTSPKLLHEYDSAYAIDKVINNIKGAAKGVVL